MPLSPSSALPPAAATAACAPRRTTAHLHAPTLTLTLTPTPALTLTLTLTLALSLQIQPEKEIVVEFIKNEDYKYVRALGAYYLRLTGRPVEIYQYLEPLYNDYRKVRVRLRSGAYDIVRMDEWIDELLTTDMVCDIALPHLPKRTALEASGLLAGPRRSALEDDLAELEEVLSLTLTLVPTLTLTLTLTQPPSSP